MEELTQDFMVGAEPDNWDIYDETRYADEAESIGEWAREAKGEWSPQHEAFYDQIRVSGDPLARLELLGIHLNGRDFTMARAAGGEQLKHLVTLLHVNKDFTPAIFQAILKGLYNSYDHLHKCKQSRDAEPMPDSDVDELAGDLDRLSYDDSDEKFHTPVRIVNHEHVLQAMAVSTTHEVEAFNQAELAPVLEDTRESRQGEFGENHEVNRLVQKHRSLGGLRQLYDFWNQDTQLVKDLRTFGVGFVVAKYGGGNRFPERGRANPGEFTPHGVLHPGTELYYRKRGGPFKHFEVQEMNQYSEAFAAFIELGDEIAPEMAQEERDRRFPVLKNVQRIRTSLWTEEDARDQQMHEKGQQEEQKLQSDSVYTTRRQAKERYPRSLFTPVRTGDSDDEKLEEAPFPPPRQRARIGSPALGIPDDSVVVLDTPQGSPSRRRHFFRHRKRTGSPPPPVSHRVPPLEAGTPPLLKLETHRTTVHTYAPRTEEAGEVEMPDGRIFLDPRRRATHPSRPMPTPIRVRTGVRMHIPRIRYVADHRRRRTAVVGPERDKARMYDNITRKKRPLAVRRPEKTTRIGEFITMEETGSRFHVEVKSGIKKGAARRLARILIQHAKTNRDAKLNHLSNGIEKRLGPLNSFSFKQLVSIIMKNSSADAVYVIQSELTGGALASRFWTHPGLSSVLSQ